MERIRQQPDFAAALSQALTLARSGAHDAAEAILLDLLLAIPDQSDALQLLGMIARQRGDHEAAVALFRRSLAANPAQPHVLNNLGNSLADLARRGEAAAAYREALRLMPGHADAAVNLGLALLAGGDAADARDTLADAVRRTPNDPRAWSVLGQALRETGALEQAVAAFGKSLALRPDHVATLHNLAVTHRLAGRPEAALQLLHRCLVWASETPEIHYNLGHCLQDLGQFDAAANAYRQVIALRPTDRAAHDSLNRLLWQQRRLDAYLASYRAALEAHPGDQGLLADFANRLILGGAAEDAVELLEPVAAAGPEIPYQLGRAYWSSGRAEAALAQFDAARAADPGFAPAAREATRADHPRPAGRSTDGDRAGAGCRPRDQQAIALSRPGLDAFSATRASAALNDYEAALIRARCCTPPGGDIEAISTPGSMARYAAPHRRRPSAGTDAARRHPDDRRSARAHCRRSWRCAR
jgi:tetratricopeptide (TPR) repeat protein